MTTTDEALTTNRGEEIRAWIGEQHEAGRTVYAATHLRTIKLTPKHAAMIRVRGTHCQVQMGKRWDSINYCRLIAR